ncbi:MAG TPA: hypothetical protein VGM60_23975 [Pseudonocardia sp.]|uniref:hypothetical protein n=1 Tax=Pseudonocardia sp. TaxID=60912 RepID=UPI002F421CA3
MSHRDELWMTCVTDGRDHLVAEDALEAGRRTGRYQALCEHEIIPASLTSPPGPTCADCAQRSDRLPAAARRGTRAGRAVDLLRGRLAARRPR